MRSADLPSPAVVVGIDGSQAAISAALWAVDEAVSRDIPLRLVYAIEPDDRSSHARDIARSGARIRRRRDRCARRGDGGRVHRRTRQDRSGDRPGSSRSSVAGTVTVGTDAVRRRPGHPASHRPSGRIDGSRPRRGRALSRRGDPRPQPNPGTPRCVVAVVDESPESHDVLDLAVTEALMRHAPLRVLTTWHPRFTDMSGADVVADNNRHIRAHQERMLSPYRRSHPELDARPVAVLGNIESYLARNADSIGLVVIGRRHSAGVADLLGLGHSMLQDAGCSVLICPVHSAL